MDKSAKTIYVCNNCGKESLKWSGKCPDCQQWNTVVQKTVTTAVVKSPIPVSSSLPLELTEVRIESTERILLPLHEFNRVLGGGVVPGSVILVSGDPGIGKSTLLLQALSRVSGKVVYVSGEETPQQIKLRASRMGIKGEGLFLLAETNIDAVLAQVEQLALSMLIIDSIQTVFTPELEGSPGNVTQVRECALRLMHWAKSSGIPVFITGHVTKEGEIAGPRLLEHIVDVALHLEGEQFSAYRLLRCIKNRFGSTNEIGVFEMTETGLAEVENPSAAFLSQRGEDSVGSAVVSIIEGSRPLLVEIQALVNATSFGLPRRTANGVDFGRLLVVAAVLSKRAGIKLFNQDIIVNATGGLKIGEPAADLGMALAIASSFRDTPVDPKMVTIGEIGLSGELRTVAQLERRISEAARLGFERALVPRAGAKLLNKDIKIIPAGSLAEALRVGLLKKPEVQNF